MNNTTKSSIALIGETERKRFQISKKFWKKLLETAHAAGTQPIFHSTKLKDRLLLQMLEFSHDHDAQTVVLYSPHGYRVDKKFRTSFADVMAAVYPAVMNRFKAYDAMEYDLGITEMGLYMAIELYKKGYNVIFTETLIPRGLMDMNRVEAKAVRPVLDPKILKLGLDPARMHRVITSKIRSIISQAQYVIELHSMQPRNFAADTEIGMTKESVNAYVDRKFVGDTRPAINVFVEHCPESDFPLRVKKEAKKHGEHITVEGDNPYSVVEGYHMTPLVLSWAQILGLVVDIRKDTLCHKNGKVTWESVQCIANVIISAFVSMNHKKAPQVPAEMK